ncbi:MAG: translocation/assembly module TamB domain-containing protein [Gemmatimonadales bacterium]
MPYRRWIRLLGIIGTTVLTLVVTLLALLQLPPVATWVLRRIITVVPLNPGYQLQVGGVSGDWLHRLVLENVRLIRKSRELARLDRLELGYDLREVRGPVTRLRELTVNGASAVAHREGETWDLTSAIKKSADTTKQGGGIRIENLKLRDVQLMAELSPDSVVRVRGLNLTGRNLVVGDTVLMAIDQLNLGISPPGSTRWFALATRGAITADDFRFDPVRIQTEETRIAGRAVLPRNLEDPRLVDRLDVRLQATPLALADLAAVVPSVASEGDLHLDARARGASDGLVTAHLGARLDEASLTLDGVAPISKGKADYRLRGSMRRLDPARLYETAPSGSLNGTIAADLRGARLERSGGRVDLRLTPSRLGRNSVRRLGLSSDIRNGSAAVTWRAAIEQGRVAGSGRIRPFDSIPEYRLRGTATDLPGSSAVARKMSGDSLASGLEVGFQLAGAGISTSTAKVTGKVTFTATQEDDPIPLGQATFSLARGRLDLDPELLLGGGTVTAHAVAHLGDTLTYEVRNGKIDRVDLARLGADTTTGPLSGRFSLRGCGTAPDQAVASLRLDFDELRYGAHRIEKLSGQARLARGTARLAFGGPLEGGRIVLEADARPFAQTKTFLLRGASLERVDLGSFLGRPDLAGPVTLRATGSGRVRGNSRSVKGRLTVEPSRLGKLEVTSGLVDVTLNGDRLTYDGSVRTNGGRVALAGDGQQLAGVRSLAIRRGQADSIDLGTLMGRPDLHTSINAGFTAQLSGDSAATRQADLSLQLLPSRINQAQLEGGRIRLNLDGDSLQGDLRLAGRDGELGAQLTGRQTGKATQLHTAGTLRVERLARWTGRADADGRLESRFTLNAAGDSAGLRSLEGRVNAIGGIGDIRINSAHLVLGADSGAIRVDTFLVQSNALALAGHGRIALRRDAGSDTLRITGTAYNLAPLARFIGDSISLDSARVALTLSGPAWRWRLDGQGEIDRILAAGNLADRVTLRATATIDSTHLSGMQGELRVKDAAYGKMRIPEARLVARYDSLIGLDADVALGDSARIVTALRGTGQADTMRATLQRLDLTQGDTAWSLEQPAQLELRPRVAVDGFALRSGKRRIVVDGVYDPEHSSDIGVHIADLNLETLRSLGLAPIGGRLDGWLRLQGTKTDPTLQGKLGLAIRQSDGRETGRVQTELNWTGEGLRINAATVPVRGGRLTVNGTLPWRLKLTPTDSGSSVGVTPARADTLALAVQADSFDLAVFNPLLPADAARDLRGRLLAHARVSGPVKAPRADGTLEISGVAVALPPLGLSYRDGAMVGRLSGDELRVEQLQLRTDKKQLLTAQGSVRLRPFNDPALDLTAKLSDFQISNSSSLQAVASGDLRLQGTAAKPSLTGNLTVGRTDITMGGAQTAVTVEKVDLAPEDLRQLAREFGPAVLAQVHESPGLVDRFHLDLNLRLPNRVWFRRTTSPKAEIELSGRIRLRQEPGQPMQFFGKVEPVPGRGTLDVYGREFRLSGGDIRLNGPVDSTTLDVTAEYQVPTQGGPDEEGVVVDVAAKGHLDSLALEFTSAPDMSQDDILSYIVTGRPSSDNPLAQGSGSGTSTGEMGASVALGTLTQSLSTTAEKQLGLDVFQIKPEGVRGLTLTAGRYVGSSLFLSMNLPIQLETAAQQTPGYNLGPSFEMEYALQRWLRAKVEAGNVPPSFTLRSRYAY